MCAWEKGEVGGVCVCFMCECVWRGAGGGERGRERERERENVCDKVHRSVRGIMEGLRQSN